jgi:hypothetical protein
MADEPINIVLEHLRKFDRKIDGVHEEVRSGGMRMAALERHMAGIYTSEVDRTSEIDRLRTRVERIERRLELSEG